ncbi:MAG TPA: Ig-like domain-containing protein [Candidatus Sulfotelmatobacter sp.]|nr:Ig-like domain-containing protein [Candidatus Sulfotelmatobacter sp.]
MASRRRSPVQLSWIVLFLSGLFFILQTCYSDAQSINLSWTPSTSTNVVGYNIYYGAVSGTYTNEISTGNVTNLTVSNLVFGATYYLTVAAVNNYGIQSALGSPVSCILSSDPSISITNATNGMVVSSSTFTAEGLVTDDVGLSAVYYSLDGNSFIAAALSGSQWNAPLNLAVGTNTLSVYVLDILGIDSATDTVKIVYAPATVLTVQTNGEGIISPNYNGSLLQVGSIYAMTATAVNGFMFTNWTAGTSGDLTPYTNGPTARFTMSSNLVMQANFVDTNKPFVSITNITQGMLVSNETFTVMGVATDNVAVAEVYYSLNGGTYSEAALAGDQWSASLNLVIGSNAVSAYAVDTSGNTSATASVTFDYAVTAAMTVQTNGEGIISPNYNGSLLEVGSIYAMTATAVNGFMFTNWTAGTAGNLTLYTNGPTARFTMSSNLVLQANFVDTNKPFLSITNVTPGMLVANGTFTVMGVATDNVAVADVYYSLNGGSYTGAALSGNQWSATLNLVTGTNTVAAYAVDEVGNISATDTVNIVYGPAAALTVQTTGEGTVSPNYNGSLLQIGQPYQMTATAVNGFMFTNWTAGTAGNLTPYTNGPTAQFIMSSNLVMQANFVDTNKPFLSITNITQGMLVSNETFTVMGVATDNVAVAQVYYSLNGGAYAGATLNGDQWSASLNLVIGTNTVSAYAVDSSSNVSATASVTFDYVVSAVMTVQTNGEGTVSPNYNGSLLQVGSIYAMTATGVNGFMFTNWTAGTAGDLTPYTNGPTARFTMSSNLVMQANFVNTNKPFLSITNITPGMQVSNATFTVMGVATDNVAVAQVYYSLNGGAYVGATLNGDQWSASLNLVVGTNTVSAYAEDGIGNVSATASVIFDYVASTAMTVRTNGEGTVSPNYNGSLLQIGQPYQMTATAVNGFMFTNWTAGTGGTLTPYTNGPTAQFTMSSNLVMQANFVDTNKPFVSITNITPGMLVSNATFTVMGVATDNVAVAEVYYSLNGGAYTGATLNGGQWSASLNLVVGTNTVSAYAEDGVGNVSATASATFDYVVSAVMTVQTNGEGTISPNYNGSLLQIGQVYQMTATGVNGFMFTNWTAGTSGNLTPYTNSPTAQFIMSSNLVLEANFVETNAPYLSITNITPGMAVSNAAFTVMGVATDNVAVAHVYYSLNNGGYKLATTSGNSWFAQLTLASGTNTVAAYAVNDAGDISATNTACIDYVVSSVLTVITNGNAALIWPNYNGQNLQIGQTYSMGELPAPGFVFSNWTGGVLGSTFTKYTNGQTVVFTMLTNLVLQANYIDTLSPYLAITNVTSGMLWTNSTFTVMGVATDDEAVASVNYSLNGSPYTNTAAINGTQWNAGLTNLLWGTNTFSAYVLATNGNLSATDTVDLVYAVSNVLTIVTNGVALYTWPYYGGQPLRIGQNYAMIAMPSTGFVFTNWIVATNFDFAAGATTNGDIVQFMMASNLTVEANFIETAQPTVAISSPASGASVTNALATAVGGAGDIWGVSGVWYQLNNNPWTRVATTNGYTNWTSTLQLAAGTNVLKACAINLGGNYSPTNTVNIISTNAFKMQFGLVSRSQTANGFGFSLDVSPGVSGRIEYSTNLIDWTVLTNFVGTNGPLTIYDPARMNGRRFYKAVVP